MAVQGVRLRGYSPGSLTMAILIVSKTRMHGDHVCVGGFDLATGRNVRLLTDQGYNQSSTTAYRIGEIWDLVCRSRCGCEPPHVEDVLVTSASRISVQPDLDAFIRENCPVIEGPLNNAFGGHLQYTGAGSAFISRGAGIPGESVCFWETNEPLRRDDFNSKVRYSFRQDFSIRHIPYVGFREPVDVIARGSLVRLSLARWWKPKDAPAEEPEKCFLQLSGYY